LIQKYFAIALNTVRELTNSVDNGRKNNIDQYRELSVGEHCFKW